MITSLKFEKFRGFDSLKISPLQRVNLIAGANNTGKTGILEGLNLLFGDWNQLTVLPSTFRSNVSGQPNQNSSDDFATFWQSLFYDKDRTLTPSIAGYIDSTGTKKCLLSSTEQGLRIEYQPIDKPPQTRRVGERPGPTDDSFHINNQGSGGGNNPFATKCIVLSTRLEQPTRDAELFNQVSLVEGGEDRLVSLLQEIDQRLQKLRYLKAPGTHQPLVYAHFGLKNAISMTQTGQGFSKLFSLFCQMLVSKARFLFVDEIENGLYYEALPVIWRGLAALANSENIQVFATTHSRECIVAAHNTFSEMASYNFALHRLQRVQNRVEAITHDREMLEVAIKSGLEVR